MFQPSDTGILASHHLFRRTEISQQANRALSAENLPLSLFSGRRDDAADNLAAAIDGQGGIEGRAVGGVEQRIVSGGIDSVARGAEALDDLVDFREVGQHPRVVGLEHQVGQHEHQQPGQRRDDRHHDDQFQQGERAAAASDR